ncbi:MAG: hypothetical protein ACR2H3_03030 [Acidimicrobiales bacterium]
MTVTETRDLEAFRARVDHLVHQHPVVRDNAYTRWFAKGDVTRDEVRHLTVQFSVFSHEFVVAQMRKVLNAADLESYRSGKEILMNELGVIFRAEDAAKAGTGALARGMDGEAVDPDLVSTEGTVDGSRFKFSAAHFEWLLRFSEPIGLAFSDLGKRHHGSEPTLFFCDELIRIYGAEDPSIAEGASYAVEHWAAAGFWKELIAGLMAFKERECKDLNLAFWTWHDKVEDQHAAHTAEELVEAFHTPGFDEEKFMAGAAEMLDGVKAFWDGLEADHLAGRTAK